MGIAVLIGTLASVCVAIPTVAEAAPAVVHADNDPSAATGPGVVDPDTGAITPAPDTTNVTDAPSADDERVAVAIATKFGHNVTVDPDTTETSKVEALPDGTLQATNDAEPARVQQGDAWVDVDPSLAHDESGFLAPVAASTPVRFSAGGDGDLAQIQLPSGEWMGESWDLGPLPAPEVDGAVATYPEALPGVDLKLTATSIGMSEVLVIKTAEAAANPDLASLDISIDGASVVQKDDGTTVATNADPAAAEPTDVDSTLRSSKPHAWDSSSEGATAAGPGGGEVGTPVDAAIAGDTISLDVAGVTDAPDVTYPVFVDPDWGGGVIHAWMIDETYPNQSYLDGYNEGQQQVGHTKAEWSPEDGRPQTARSFWDMDTSVVASRHILNARFNVTETWSNTCDPIATQLWWTGNVGDGANWNESQNVAFIQLLDTNYESHGGLAVGCTDDAAVGFDATGGVVAAAAALAPSVTLAIKTADETDPLTWREYTVDAQLIITYNVLPDLPQYVGIANPPRGCSTISWHPVYVNPNLPMTLQGIFGDHDGGNVAARYHIVSASDGGHNMIPGLAPSGYIQTPMQAQGVITTTIPAHTLPDNTGFAIGVETFDGTDSSGVWGYCFFTTDATPPALPSVTVAGTGTVGLPMSATITSNLNDHVAAFEYWWTATPVTSSSPPLPVPTGSGGTPPACGSAAGGARFVCPDASGKAVIQTAPMDTTSTLWVASFDLAGNVSMNAGGTPIAKGTQVNAGADSAHVAFGPGHGWALDQLASPLPSTVPDQNTSSTAGAAGTKPLSIGSGNSHSGTGTIPGVSGQVSAISLPGYVMLDRVATNVDHASSTDGIPLTGYGTDALLGYLAPLKNGSTSTNGPAGTTFLYECTMASGERFSTTSSNCESSGTGAHVLGYIWTSRPATVPDGPTWTVLNRCYIAAGHDHFDSPTTSCEGTTFEKTLGYVANITSTQTASSAVDTTKSFTVSAWVNPASSDSQQYHAIVSQAGAVNTGFDLQLTPANVARFCVRSQATGTLDCAATSSALQAGTWTFVTGIWDATNQELRVLTGSNIQPAGVSTHVVPANDPSAAGVLLVGLSLANKSPSSQWSGQIIDPTIFPGVVNSDQLANLYYLSAPQ